MVMTALSVIAESDPTAHVGSKQRLITQLLDPVELRFDSFYPRADDSAAVFAA